MSNILRPYVFNESITQPLRVPGGRRFIARVIASTSILLLLAYLVFGRSLVANYVEFFQLMLAMDDPENVEAMTAMMNSLNGVMLPAMGLWIAGWLIMASAEAAFHLNILKGVDRGWFPLRFGMPELGVWVAQLVVGLIVFGVYFAGYILIIILVVIAAISAESAGAVSIIVGIFAVIAGFAWLGAMIYAALRLSPAAALSIRDGDIRTIEGWKISKNHVWPMLGGYAVIWIIGYVASIFIMLIAFFLAFGSASIFEPLGGLSSNEDPQIVFAALGDILKTPRVIIGSIVGFLVFTIFNLIWRCFFWGIPNYVVQIESETVESVFGDQPET